MEKRLTAEMKRKMDNLMNHLLSNSKPDIFEKTLTEFLEQHFNPILSFGLIQKYKNKYNINSFKEMTLSEKMEFADNMVKNVFKRIRTPGEITGLRNQAKSLIAQNK